MPNVAFLVANSAYKTQADLPCCANDIEAMRALITATGRFEQVASVQDVEADELKRALREFLDKHSAIEEFFFYFTGHGHQHDAESYFCGTTFDSKRPNETGLSNSELHELLRSSDPNLVVKVIDACHSGGLLIKSQNAHPRVDKGAFRNIIQISSCLDTQVSLTGVPLSKFTKSFCDASVRKAEGAVFYTDLVAALRDDYLDDDSQTPHFISQSTGRDIFVDDVKRLVEFRTLLQTKWSPAHAAADDLAEPTEIADEQEVEPSLFDLLTAAERATVKPQEVSRFIDDLFDAVKAEIQEYEFSEMFDVDIIEHSDFRENTSRGFIIKSLHRESRPDDFVTADIIKTRKKRGPFGLGAITALALYGDDDFDETWDLRLNCKLDRCQMRVSFNPKFISLQKLNLVVTCAPSLTRCYVFEHLMMHKRTDFDSFADDGLEIVRKWYKLDWRNDTNWLVRAICDRLSTAVENHISSAVGKA